MDKLVLVGCSLSEQWVRYFTEPHRLNDYNLTPYEFTPKITNIYEFRKGGGGNSIGVHALLNLYLELGEEIKNTRIVCQFTGGNRHSINKVEDDESCGFKIKNVITGDIDSVVTEGGHTKHSYGDEAIDNTFNSLQWSTGSTIRDLTSILCLLSNMGADVYAFNGWVGTMNKRVWKEVDRQLTKHGVTTDSRVSYMEYAISASTRETEPWLDDYHPSTEVALRAMHILAGRLFKEENNDR